MLPEPNYLERFRLCGQVGGGGPEGQIPVQVLFIFSGLPRELHLDDAVDPLRHLQPIFRFHADADILDSLVYLIRVTRYPLIDDVAIPLPWVKESLSIRSNRLAQPLALVQQVNLRP